jgi:hypothetical protein
MPHPYKRPVENPRDVPDRQRRKPMLRIARRRDKEKPNDIYMTGSNEQLKGDIEK